MMNDDAGGIVIAGSYRINRRLQASIDASREIRQVLLCVADRRWDPVFPVKEHKSRVGVGGEY